MAQEHLIESIANRIADALRSGIPQELPADLRERLRPMVASALERAQLVPREEFERQLALLERLESHARRLEERVAALEAEAQQRGPGDDAGA